MNEKKCENCKARVACLELGGKCFLSLPGLDTENLHSYKVGPELKDFELSFEHRGCPSLPRPDEIAMFYASDGTGDNGIVFKCEYCGCEMILWSFEK